MYLRHPLWQAAGRQAGNDAVWKWKVAEWGGVPTSMCTECTTVGRTRIRVCTLENASCRCASTVEGRSARKGAHHYSFV